MKHVRTLIRDAVVELLKGTPAVGDNVWRSAFHPLAPADLAAGPHVRVFYEDEAVEGGTMGAIDREPHLIVQCVARAFEDVEDVLDAVAVEVERRLPSRIESLTYNGRLFETRFNRSGEGDAEIMAMELAYAFRYMTAYNDPTQVTH